MAEEITCLKCGYIQEDDRTGQQQICPRCFYGIDVSGTATSPTGEVFVATSDPTNPYSPPSVLKKKRFRSPLNPVGLVVIVAGVLVLGLTIWIFLSTGWFYGILLGISVAIMIAGFFLLTGG